MQLLRISAITTAMSAIYLYLPTCMLDVYFWCQMKLCLSVYLYNLRSDSIICFKLPFRIGAAWVLKERLVPDGEGHMCIFIKAGIGIGSSYLSDLVQQTLSLIIRLWFSIVSNLLLPYLLKPSTKHLFLLQV